MVPTARTWGPYPHGQRWRLVVRVGPRRRTSVSFSTREDALAEKARLLGVDVDDFDATGFQRPQVSVPDATWIYFIRPMSGRRRLVKIGKSRCLRRRFLAIAALVGPIEVIGVLREGARWTEARLHERFTGQRRDAEWFAFSGALERFIAANAEPYAEVVRVVMQTRKR